MSEGGAGFTSYLNVWVGLILMHFATAMFTVPVAIVYSFAWSYDGYGQELVKFTAMMGATWWWLWVAFLFFFPTGFKLIKRAKEVKHGGESLAFQDAIDMVRQGVSRTIPFYDPDAAGQ